MTPRKLKSLLLDANIIIELHRLRLWDEVTAKWCVLLAETVVGEAQFYSDDKGVPYDIDLQPYIDEGKVDVFELTPSEVQGFLGKFGPIYLEQLDPGEAETLAYLLGGQDRGQLCSADKIVYRVLGNASRSADGISLEEVLQQVGLGRSLDRPFTKAYREEWTKKGFADHLGGRGLR